MQPLPTLDPPDAAPSRPIAARVRDVAILLAILLAAVARFRHEDMVRPFEVDELITTRYYTWAGLQPSGEERPLPHITEYYALPRPGLAHFVMGIYCAVGRWPEPNNHIVGSLLINISQTLFGCHERSARLPALFGAVVFAWSLYFFFQYFLRWHIASFFAPVWAWYCPHVLFYSQDARGYSWMLALQIWWLICVYQVAARPGSIAWGAAAAGIAVASVLNLVHMLSAWVVPAYIALWLGRPGFLRSSAAEMTSWRRNLNCQVLGIGSVVGLFYLSHLPAIYSSLTQYGLRFHNADSFIEALGTIAGYHFPNLPWSLFALCGAMGLVSLNILPDRFPRRLLLSVLVVNFVAAVATGCLPYERTAGFMLPLLFLGAGALIEMAPRVSRGKWERGAILATFAAMTALAATSSATATLAEPQIRRRLEFAALKPPDDIRSFQIIRLGPDYTFLMYVAPGWNFGDACVPEVLTPGLIRRLCWFQSVKDPYGGRFDFHRSIGRTIDFSAQTRFAKGMTLIWYPDPRRLGLRGEQHLEFLRAQKLDFETEYTRDVIKLDVFSRILCHFFPVRSEKDLARVRTVLAAAASEFGGRVIAFVPERHEVDPIPR